MSTRKVTGATLATMGIVFGGITQGSDWHPDRLRFAVILAAYLTAIIGFAVWDPSPTAQELYVEAERSTWPGWRQAIAPIGALAFLAQLILKLFGADHHHLVAAQISTASVLAVCVGIGTASFLRRAWRQWREGGSGTNRYPPGTDQ
jgi:hypothetical protein